MENLLIYNIEDLFSMSLDAVMDSDLIKDDGYVVIIYNPADKMPLVINIQGATKEFEKDSYVCTYKTDDGLNYTYLRKDKLKAILT